MCQFFLYCILTFFLCNAAIASFQYPFDTATATSANDSQILHSSSPDHYIEVRAPNLCVGQDLWTGYFHSTRENVSLFFLFARASRDPETAPLALWTNGGPGTSGLGMAFSGATGCVVEDGAALKMAYKFDARRKRWNDNVNVVFVEQPIGTGYSRGNGRGEEDTRVGAELIYEFIQVLLSRHPHFTEVSLHGLSYGGHFIPEWAHRIVTENAKVKEGKSSRVIIPLKSISIGNGWYGSDVEYTSVFDSLCDEYSFPSSSISGPLLTSSECKRLSEHRSTCVNLLHQCRKQSPESCGAAYLWCTTSIGLFITQTGRNQYDVSSFSADAEVFAQPSLLTRYLNLPAVQIALGVITADDPRPFEWTWNNRKVSDLHVLAGDHARRTDVLLPGLVDSGVDVLLYDGTLDIICGYQGARRLVQSLGLIDGHVDQDLKVWQEGKGRYLCSIGRKDRVGKFCYLEIDGVGHSVASDYNGWSEVFENWILERSV
jgi:carboxypeptidase C (cathepsin A)